MFYTLFRPIIILFALILTAFPSWAQEGEVIDEIVAVVNDHIILRSDVDMQMQQYMQQTQQRSVDENLWYEILESQVFRFMLLEKAKMDSVVVSDDQVDRALNQQINQMLQQAGSEERLEQALGQSLTEVRAEYRELFREEMMIDQVRTNRMQRVNITRPEVVEFYDSIPEDELPVVEESVELAQIVAVPPPLEDARVKARNKAESLRDSIVNYDRDIEELAIRYSDGRTASSGGRLPQLNLNQLLPSYAAAASALEPGEISEVVETPDGFHVIKLNERSGDQLTTTHILIELGSEELDDQYAIDKLNALKDSVETGKADFAELARRHSEDRATAPTGGRLRDQQTGQRRIPVSRLETSLRNAISDLEPGEITEPHEYEFGGEGEDQEPKTGYRIVLVRDHIPEHVANLEDDYDMIRRAALEQKQQEKLNEWFDEMRQDVYVEYRVDMPDVDPQLDIEEPVEGGQQQAPPPQQQQQQQPPPPPGNDSN